MAKQRRNPIARRAPSTSAGRVATAPVQRQLRRRALLCLGVWPSRSASRQGLGWTEESSHALIADEHFLKGVARRLRSEIREVGQDAPD